MPGGLPRPRTPFFGRHTALGRIERLLGDHRLVTLTGVGGAGKTRLALRLAEEVVPDRADAVVWVGLASLTDGGLVWSAACTGAGVRLQAGTSPVDALIARLGPTGALLVLDNCEHVLDGCAELATEVLDRCPRVRILATSREPLGLADEVLWPVLGLSVPSTGDEAGADVANASRFESVQLFVDRVRAARPEFELTTGNVEAVARVCRDLEGIPLALELAAARARVLGPEQIAQRLDEGLGVLSQTGRSVPPRHRTMRAALSWSHDLLEERERVLFRRLGVFGGDASIRAIEIVCSVEPLEQDDVLDLLTRLVDRSLVTVDDRGASVRYRLLEPVRRFAIERLEESGELEHLRRRHAEFFLDLADETAPSLGGPDRATALDRLEMDHGNLRSAWDGAVATADGEALARFARALFWFWNFGGHFDEGRKRCEAALDRIPEASRGWADLLWAAGALAWMQGDYDLGRTRLQASVSRCREEGRDDLLPLALRELAGTQFSLGNLTAASELYAESAALFDAGGRSWHRGLVLVVWADVRQALGDAEPARQLREEARALFGAAGDPWGLSLAHFGLGLEAAQRGDIAAARRHANEALALQGTAGDDWNAGQILVLLGEVETRDGRPELATELLRQCIEAFRSVGDRISLSHALACMAASEADRGRTLRAVRLAGAAHGITARLEAPYLYSLATDEERAAVIERLREAAGEEAFVAEWAAGRVMSLDDAVAFALGDPHRAPGDTVTAHGGATPAHPGATGARLRIFALGSTDVFRGRRRLRPEDWGYALPRELLFFLLLEGPRTKEQIGLEFWPDVTTDQLRGRFRTALYQLRRALGATEWVRYEHGRYGFNHDLDYWFDVEAFEGEINNAWDATPRPWRLDPRSAAAPLQRAVDLYRGDLLEGDAPGRWASGHRDRLRRRYLEALLKLGELRTAEGAHEAAVRLYGQAIVCDEFHEPAHQALARARARAGDRAGALRQLDDLTRILRDELDLDPSAQTVGLRSRLEQGLDA
jgi:predicted ATPase/DNA-binding SARP family transcriptional activator